MREVKRKRAGEDGATERRRGARGKVGMGGSAAGAHRKGGGGLPGG
jgi:hypothetical protein